MAAHIWFQLTTHFIDPERMKGWVGLVGWPLADGLATLVVTHQLQVERRTGKVRRPETDVLPLCHATNLDAGYYSLPLLSVISARHSLWLFSATWQAQYLSLVAKLAAKQWLLLKLQTHHSTVLNPEFETKRTPPPNSTQTTSSEWIRKPLTASKWAW